MSYVDDSRGQSGAPPLDDLDLERADDVDRRPGAGRRQRPAPEQRIASMPTDRLVLGQTAVDFWGRRRTVAMVSVALLFVGAVALLVRGLNLGVEFDDAVTFDVPAGEVSVDDARSILDDNGFVGAGADVSERSSDAGDIVKVRVADAAAEERNMLREAFAAAAGVQPDDVRVAASSDAWDDDVTRRGAIAVGVFVLVALLLMMIRFRWQAVVATFAALVHDVVIAAGLYALFGFEVTASTAAALVAVTAYSLYDKAMMFDRVRENERRVVAAGRGTADVINVSANQSLTRWLVTSVSLVLPVIVLLVAGLFGEPTLRNLGIGLLFGMALAAYSTVFVALPLLAILKRAGSQADVLAGDELRTVVVRGVGILTPLTTRRRPGARPAAARRTTTLTAARPDATTPGLEQTTEQLLGRTPRPRKKKRH